MPRTHATEQAGALGMQSLGTESKAQHTACLRPAWTTRDPVLYTYTTKRILCQAVGAQTINPSTHEAAVEATLFYRLSSWTAGATQETLSQKKKTHSGKLLYQKYAGEGIRILSLISLTLSEKKKKNLPM